jgi:hypothetical protein
MKISYIIIGILAIIIVGFLFFISTQQFGPGTAYEFRIIRGCENFDRSHGLDFNVTDHILDSVLIEHGYGKSGFEKVTFREYCQNSENFKECVESRKSIVFFQCVKWGE